MKIIENNHGSPTSSIFPTPAICTYCWSVIKLEGANDLTIQSGTAAYWACPLCGGYNRVPDVIIQRLLIPGAIIEGLLPPLLPDGEGDVVVTRPSRLPDLPFIFREHD